MQRFTSNIAEWNYSVFGNIFARKKRLICRLQGIQNKLLEGPNPFLYSLRSKLWDEYSQVLDHEKAYWFHLSRSKWMAQGDKNTKFFHQSTLSRQRKNRIEALRDSNGDWCYDNQDIPSYPFIPPEDLPPHAIPDISEIKDTLFGIAMQVSSCLGVQRTDNLGLYLGIPTLHKRTSRDIYSHIVDKLLKAKYNFDFPFQSPFFTSNKDSVLWKAIAKMGQNLDQCTCWILGDGLSTRFWKDIFVPNCGRLCDHHIASIPVDMKDLPKFSANGEFTIKSAYEFLLSASNVPRQEDEIFKLIWSWQGPPRISAFIWKALHRRLLTKSERAKRGMTQDDNCPKCNCNKETLIHALRDCESVAELWESLIDPNDWASFFSLGQEQWIRKYLEFSGNVVAGVAWSFLFPVGIWMLWKDINSLVFKNKTDLLGNLFFHIVSHSKRILEVVAAPKPIAQRIFRKEELIGWKPPVNFFKLNVDGSVLGSCSQASCGGLQAITNSQLSNVIINIDSKLAVQLVKAHCPPSHHCYQLVRKIKQILSPNPSFFLSHSLRESIRCADLMAALGQNHHLGTT
ncbi:Reverse transcriptase zinc-binding domain [Sesbania bispinosa]|nr:Reverse transcriptase zinc-binding domain [Sesbania bispinosa]